MNNRLAQIQQIVGSFQGCQITSPFIEKDGRIAGAIVMTVDDVILPFEVEVFPHYPFQVRDLETIRFINKDLLPLSHINSDGSVCVHTVHHPELTEKLQVDLAGLQHWILRYYINKEKDARYEHILINHSMVHNENPVFLFTDVNHTFINGMHGFFDYSILNDGSWKKEKYVTYLVQSFSVTRDKKVCKWSEVYRQLPVKTGLYYYSDNPPAINRRFSAETFSQLQSFFNQAFLARLEKQVRQLHFKQPETTHIPLLIGYPTVSPEIHWQVIMLPLDALPVTGQRILGTNNWRSVLSDQEIVWGQTRNTSFGYFFGRGAFHSKIVKGKILIIGIGAVGSMLATTLVRGGATDMVLVDHDVKEPENICRSEYAFITGVTAKAQELSGRLSAISPFADVRSSETLTDLFKYVVHGDDTGWIKSITDHLNEFDMVFDCSTDNDIAWLMSSLELQTQIFSISITNHAKELVCATGDGVYPWLQQIYAQLKQDSDMYEPVGCWSPTFRASYNDIAVLVQHALRHINGYFDHAVAPRKFVLSTKEELLFEIKLTEY